MRLARLIPFALAALVTTRVDAQVTAPTDYPVAVQFQNIAGVNPIGLIPGLLSAEVEHLVAPGFSVGLGGTHQSIIGNKDYDVQSSWLDAKAKYYPSENGFRGFSVGVTAGFLRSHGARDGNKLNPIQHKGAGTIGIVADYNWLLGRTQRLYVGTGLGAKRVFGPTGDESILNPVFPYLRAQLGRAV
jgi:hypothetical protein